MPTLTERIALIIDATGVGAIGEFKKVAASAKKELGAVDKATAGTRSETGLLSKGLNRLGLSSIDSGSALKAGVAAGATAAAVALVKFGKDSVQAFSSATADVSRFKRVAGGTAESASQLVSAMKTLKVDTEAGAKAFGILSKNIENTPGKLSAIGVAVAKNKDGTNDLAGTLLNVSKAYNATSDQAEKNVIALTAFGKGGLALTPILARGAAGLKELYAQAEKHHEIFSDEDLKKGKEFRLATTELSNAFHGLEIEAGSALVPTLTRVAVGLTHIVEAGDKLGGGLSKSGLNFFNSTFDSFLPKVEAGQGLVGILGEKMGLLHEKTKGAGDATGQLSSSASAAETAIFNEAIAAGKAATDAGKLAAAQDKVNQAFLSAPGAQLSYEQSLVSIRQGEDNVRDAQKALTDAVAAHGAKSNEARTATLNYQQAQLGLRGDLGSVAQAAANVADKTALAAGHQNTAAESARAQKTALQDLKAKLPELTPIIDAYIAALDRIPGVKNTNVTVNGSTTTTSNSNPSRTGSARKSLTADGGIFSGAQERIIGEAGPEAVIPLSASKRGRAKSLMAQSGMAGWADGGIAGFNGTSVGGTTNVTIVMPPGSDGQDVVNTITAYFRKGGAKPHWAA